MGLGLLPGDSQGSQGSGGLFWGYRRKGTEGGPDPRLRSGDRYRERPCRIGKGSPPAGILRASAAPRPVAARPTSLAGRVAPRPASLAGCTALCRSLAADAASHRNAVSRSACPPASRCHWLSGEARLPLSRRYWLF